MGQCAFPTAHSVLLPFFSLSEATTSTGGSGPTEAELPGGKLFQFEALVFVYSFIGLLIY